MTMYSIGTGCVNTKLFTGTLDLLVLEVVSEGPTYGYAITQTVLGRSQGALELTEGSLYPALHRLERQKFLKAEWRDADGRRRKYYRLTSAGSRELERRQAEWTEFVRTMENVLGGAHGMA